MKSHAKKVGITAAELDHVRQGMREAVAGDLHSEEDVFAEIAADFEHPLPGRRADRPKRSA